MSVNYGGMDTGNDLVFQSTINHHTETASSGLAAGTYFQPSHEH